MASEIGDRRAQLAYDSLEQAFPEIDPNFEPFGSFVLVQIRSAMSKTKGGIVLTHDTQDTEKWNAQVAKILAVGPASFKNRDTLEPWKEGEWCQPGEYVRVPKYGGDRWEVENPKTKEMITVVVFNDLDLRGRIPRPLETVAYVY